MNINEYNFHTKSFGAGIPNIPYIPQIPTMPTDPSTSIPQIPTMPTAPTSPTDTSTSVVPNTAPVVTIVGKYQAGRGKFENGARLDISTYFATNIGGVNDGATTITVKTTKEAMYEFSIQYLANESRPFKIDVNAISTGATYTSENTDGNTALDAKIFVVKIRLNLGDNKVKFHGSALQVAPDFGQVVVKTVVDNVQENNNISVPTISIPIIPTIPTSPIPITPSTIPTNSTNPIVSNPSTIPTNTIPQQLSYPILVGKFQASKGILANGAKLEIDDKFAGWIGGPSDGSTTIVVNVDKAGSYEFLVQYISAESRVFKVDVNGVSTGGVYTPESTIGWEVQDAKIVALKLQLNAGENKVKFHGNGVDYAQSFGEIIVNIVKDTFSTVVTPTPTPNTTPTNTTPQQPSYPILVGKFKASEGILANGAKVEIDGKFAGWIGGPSDGSTTITVSVDKAGSYEFLVQYISAESRVFKVDVNGVSTGGIYTPESTVGWEVQDAKIVALKLQLNAGENKVKFHGNGVDYAQSFGEIIVNIVKDTFSTVVTPTPTPNTTPTNTTPQQPSYPILVGKFKASEGILANGAKVEIDGKFAGWIGGPSDGSITIIVNVDRSGVYEFLVEYIAAEPRVFKVDVNGVSTGGIYTPESTVGWEVQDAKIVALKLQLNAGENKVKFHGNGVDYAQSFGEIIVNIVKDTFSTVVTPTPTPNTTPTNTTPQQPSYPILVGKFKASEGILANGAKVEIDGKFAGWIGGQSDGSITIIVNVDRSGVYEFLVEYIAAEPRVFKVDINGVSTGVIYTPESTVGWTVQDAKIVALKLQLNAGENKVKFHGNGVDYAQSFGEITVNIVKDTFSTPTPNTTPTNTPSPQQSYPILVEKFQAAKGILANGAKLEIDDKFAGWIGGQSDGSTTITVNVDRAGSYEFLVQYIAAEPRVFKVDVNGVSTGVIYNPESTVGWTVQDAKIFNLKLQLNAGENKVKFHGNGVDYAQSFGEITVNIVKDTFSTPTPNTTPTNTTPQQSSYPILVGKFQASKGILANGAKLEIDDKFAGWIGGPSDGSTTITVNVDKAGNYEFLVQYIAVESRVFKVDVNGISTGVIYNPESTVGWELQDAKVFNLKLQLNAGENKVKFHGNGVDYAQSFGEITVNIVKDTFSTPVIQIPTPAPNTTSTNTASPQQNYPILVGKFQAAKGILANGAKLWLFDKFVAGIGGASDGSTTITVNVDRAGRYEFLVQYITIDTRVFKVDINGVNTGDIYAVEGTIRVNMTDSKIIVLKLQLNTGENKVKFHGNGIDSAPIFGEITVNIVKDTFNTGISVPAQSATSQNLTYPILVGKYSLAQGQLENGSKVVVENGFIGLVGGSSDGSSTIKVNVGKAGVYEVLVQYVCGETRPFKIDVNGISTEIIYRPEKTNSWNMQDVKNFSLRLQLNAGENKIKFHGNGSDYAPDLGIVTINITATTFQSAGTTTNNSNGVLTYNATDGILANGAKLELDDNFVGFIGGINDGSTTIIVSVDNTGVYGVSMDYIGADTDRILAIDVNGNNISINSFAKTNGWTIADAKTFNTSLNLNLGTNKIKFHGNGKDFGPSLGVIKIYNLKTLSIEDNIILLTYDIALGELRDGAIIDRNSTTLSLDASNSGQFIDISTNFAMNLGGPQDGSSSVVVNVKESTRYTLSIDYLSGDVDRNMKIDINNQKLAQKYKMPKTKSWKKEDKNTFDIDIVLNKGANLIKFHGDGINKAPYLGKFDIKRSMSKDSTHMTIFGSAIVNGEVIEGIGGKNNGEVILRVSIDKEGTYDFAIDYLANDKDKKIEIEVNGSNTGTIYDFEKTDSMAIIDKKTKIIKLNLDKGVNIIRIFN